MFQSLLYTEESKDQLRWVGSRPGTHPVLSCAEDRLASYLVEMAKMGFGLCCQEVMHLAFQIAEQRGIEHPFKNSRVGRKQFESFRSRHPNLMLHTPEALSYARARSVNARTIEDFLAKLAAIYAHQNLYNGPMQVFNIDERGVNVIQHRGRVVTEVKGGVFIMWQQLRRGRTTLSLPVVLLLATAYMYMCTSNDNLPLSTYFLITQKKSSSRQYSGSTEGGMGEL